MRRALAVLSSLGLLLLLAAPTALATTTRMPYSCHTYRIAEVSGKMWTTGDILHVRGWQGTYTAVGSELCAGITHVVVNYDLDTAQLTGNMTFTYDEQLASGAGGIAGSAATKFDFVAAIWSGTTVGHGYGVLEGIQTRGTIVELFDETVVESGIVFVPGT